MTPPRKLVERTEKKRPVRWDQDLLDYEISPRPHPLPVPDVGIFADPRTCVTVNKTWLSHLTGVLNILLEPDAWSGDEATVYSAQQQVQLLLSAFATGACDPEGDLITGIRFNNCVMEYTTDGATWTPVAGFDPECFTGPQGPEGPPGPQGPEGPPGENCDCEPTNPPPAIDPEDPNYDPNICGIATEIVEFVFAMSDDTVNSLNAALSIPALVSSVIGITLVGDLIVDNVIAAATAIGFLGTTSYTAALTAGVKQDLICALYCTIRANNGNTAKSGTYQQWRDAYFQENPGIAPAVDIWFGLAGAMGDEEWNIRCTLGAQSPSPDCELLCDCDEGTDCAPVALTWSNVGATPVGWSSLGVVDTSGWSGSVPSDWSGDYSCSRSDNQNWSKASSTTGPRIGIKLVFDEPCLITRFRFRFAGPSQNSKTMVVAGKLPDGTMQVISTLTDLFPTPFDLDWNVSSLPVNYEVTELWFMARSGTGANVTVFITANEVN